MSQTRESMVYLNMQDKFKAKFSYSNQYNLIYKKRLSKMLTLLPYDEDKEMMLWNPVRIKVLSDQGICCIVGIMMKTMKNYPKLTDEDNLLIDELGTNMSMSETKEESENKVIERITDESDKLYKEDSYGRIELFGNIDVSKYVSGVFAALIGHPTQNASYFNVLKIVHCSPAPQPPLQLAAKSKYIMFISDLGYSKYMDNHTTSKYAQIVKFLRGTIDPSEGLTRIDSRSVARVILMGNILSEDTKKVEDILLEQKEQNEDFDDEMALKLFYRDRVESMKLFDLFVKELGHVIEVDIMPGVNETNITSAFMPQKPLAPLFFPESQNLTTVNCVSNPYLASYDGILVLGISSQGPFTMLRQTSYPDILSCMEAMLKWRHLIPMAPESVPCKPFTDSDPFIIDNNPHVFFTAGQRTFEDRLIDLEGTKVHLFVVPSFINTFSVVLLNTSTLAVETMSFK